MARVEQCDDGAIMWDCPGCGLAHQVYITEKQGRPCWGWNRSLDRPTFTPSVRVRWGDQVCHFFVRDGVVEFCRDSTHDKAGQVVPLPDILEE